MLVDACNVAAGKVRLELEKMASVIQKKQIKDTRQRHKQEVLHLQDQFDNEVHMFNEFWRAKIEHFEMTCRQIRDELSERHSEEKEKHKDFLKATLHVKPGMTPEVVNTEYQIQKLVKAQRYFEADRLLKKSESMVVHLKRESNIESRCR